MLRFTFRSKFTWASLFLDELILICSRHFQTVYCGGVNKTSIFEIVSEQKKKRPIILKPCNETRGNVQNFIWASATMYIVDIEMFGANYLHEFTEKRVHNTSLFNFKCGAVNTIVHGSVFAHLFMHISRSIANNICSIPISIPFWFTNVLRIYYLLSN